MTKKNFDTFIDFGKSGIRVGSFFKGTEKFQNDFEIKITDKQIESSSNRNEIIEKLILDIEKKNNEYLEEVYLMIDDLNVLPVSITIFKKNEEHVSDNDQFKSIIDDVNYHIKKNYVEYEIIHMVLKNFVLDEKKYFELPKNLSYKKLAVNFLFILYPKNFLESFRKIFAKQNVTIKKFIFSSYSKSLFYLDKIDEKKKIIFVDIGYKKTCAFFFRNSKVEGFKVLPIGGNHITKDISQILKIDHENAEEIKLNLDSLNNIKDYKYEDIELIKKIIFSRIEELLEISTLFKETNNSLDDIKLVFFGNGSKILDNKFKSNITFNHNIDLLDENYMDTTSSGLNLIRNENKEMINKIDTKQIKKGFFEKFFNLFS